MSSFKQFRTYLVPSLLIIILAVSILAVYSSHLSESQAKGNPNAYVGVAFGGNTTEEAKVLIDKVEGYTNLFILDVGRNPISANQSSVEEICDYAVSQGLSVIINMGVKDITDRSDWNWFWQQHSLDGIKQRWTQMWGNKFLGIYYNDEVGGVQIDANWAKVFSNVGDRLDLIDHPAAKDMHQVYLEMLDAMANGTQPQGYDLEANFFVNDVLKGDPGLQNLTAADIPIFTSDYGLYWWDYLGGYNTLFTELGWNASVSEQIALVKGAARLQDKDWGAMITWKFDQAPYLDSGDQIYNQMMTSYEAGAKYIVVFNYPYDGSSDYGTLTDQQFIALERFWNDITHRQLLDLSSPVAALVLPKNFGWGMRNPNDTIWGFWLSDNRTQPIAIEISELLSFYGPALDIVFDDPAYPVSNVPYQHVYYWNQTINL